MPLIIISIIIIIIIIINVFICCIGTTPKYKYSHLSSSFSFPIKVNVALNKLLNTDVIELQHPFHASLLLLNITEAQWERPL